MVNSRTEINGAQLDLYIPDEVVEKKALMPLVLICPGGGYFFCSACFGYVPCNKQKFKKAVYRRNRTGSYNGGQRVASPCSG